MDTWISVTIVLSTWVVSALLSVPYYYIGFIRYLGIFASVTIVLTLMALIGAAIIYGIYLKPASRLSTQLSPPTTTKHFDSVESAATSVCDIADNENNNDCSTEINKPVATTVVTKKVKKLKIQLAPSKPANVNPKMKSLERSANKSFLLMLIVFFLTYLPAIIMTIYMNVCRDCDCVAIHCLRDLTYLAILSSALWRPLNFILRLKNIRRQAKELLCGKSRK